LPRHAERPRCIPTQQMTRTLAVAAGDRRAANNSCWSAVRVRYTGNTTIWGRGAGCRHDAAADFLFREVRECYENRVDRRRGGDGGFRLHVWPCAGRPGAGARPCRAASMDHPWTGRSRNRFRPFLGNVGAAALLPALVARYGAGRVASCVYAAGGRRGSGRACRGIHEPGLRVLPIRRSGVKHSPEQFPVHVCRGGIPCQ